MTLSRPLHSSRAPISPRISILPGAAAVVALIACSSGTATAATLTVTPSLDNSIYSESDASNGTGDLFIGRTQSGAIRRALVQFDLGLIPAGSVIEQVTVSFTQTQIGPGSAANFQLSPLLASWGEGTSNGTGAGGAATSNDATWNYRLFNTDSWASPGGDFAGAPSGTSSFGTTNSVYTFTSQPSLVADVQAWLNSPSTNHGWILRAANEGPSATTARRLGSRETPTTAPVLTVTYSPVPEPGAAAMLVVAGVTSLFRRPRCRS